MLRGRDAPVLAYFQDEETEAQRGQAFGAKLTMLVQSEARIYTGAVSAGTKLLSMVLYCPL
jgi:hypothetical protein